MGVLVSKHLDHGGSHAYATSSSSPPPSTLGAESVLKDQLIDGILNLENRQITNDVFAKISTLHNVTKLVVSLSLANNRLTTLVFDDSHPSLGGQKAVALLGATNTNSAGGGVASQSVTGNVTSRRTSSGEQPAVTAASASAAASPFLAASSSALSIDDDDPPFDIADSARMGVGCTSTPIKPLPAAAHPPILHRSNNWPLLENLDLSGNTELFHYAGLNNVGETLRSLRLANNGIFKVPKEVWCLSNLTKLDLSHNRLLVVPAGISLLTKLNSLKLSHNSLTASNTASCIPEEMKFCTRLRRLDLSYNKLRELPVNWRVDRENAQNAMAAQQRRANANASKPPSHTRTQSNTTSGAANNIALVSPPSSATTQSQSSGGLKGGAGFGSVTAAASPVTVTDIGATSSNTSTSTSTSSVSTTSTSGSNSLTFSFTFNSAPPPPIKYFDPNRISYTQITLLNLSNNQIDSLSPSIGLLRSLNSLNLGYNKLRSLPTEIALLSELKYLDLRFNQLPALLTEICQLPRLSKLCVQNNKISSLPYEIRKLKKLTHFFLSSNQLVDLPDVISEMRNVRVIKLCNNRLLTLPDSIFRLQKLRLLDLSFNRLTYLSPDVANMPVIEDLRLWGNKLTDIPPPILYADVKKIIAYLRASDRERFVMASQMRNIHGARNYSRMSLKSASYNHSARNRTQSATRVASAREAARFNTQFSPLGFYNENENEPRGQGTQGGGAWRGGGTAAAAAAAAAASSSARTSSANAALGASGQSKDSSSDTDAGSDDEFTSMFRTTFHSRTKSLTPWDAAPPSARGSGPSSRRSAGTTRAASSSVVAASAASPRDGTGSISVGTNGTTLVQPISSFQLANGFVGDRLSLVVGVATATANGSRRGSAAGPNTAGPTPSGSPSRRRIHYKDEKEEDDDDDDDASSDDDHVDADEHAGLRGSSIVSSRLSRGRRIGHGLRPISTATSGPGLDTDSDVLNDVVKREWPRLPISPNHASSVMTGGVGISASPVSPRSVASSLTPNPLATATHPSSSPIENADAPEHAAQLMQEWDSVSAKIVTRQQCKGGPERGSLNASPISTRRTMDNK